MFDDCSSCLQADSRHVLYGPALRHCPKLLQRIFRMRQLPGQLVWKCDLALTAPEWFFMKGVLAHPRLRPLLQSGTRVLEPLPSKW